MMLVCAAPPTRDTDNLNNTQSISVPIPTTSTSCLVTSESFVQFILDDVYRKHIQSLNKNSNSFSKYQYQDVQNQDQFQSSLAVVADFHGLFLVAQDPNQYLLVHFLIKAIYQMILRTL
jgi:hypothetical protein